MKEMMDKISENDKRILKSVAPLVIIAVLFFVVIKVALPQLSSLKSQITGAKKVKSVLTEKIKILSSVSAMIGDNSAIYALPKSNPALQAVSNLNLLASTNSVSVSDIRSSIANSGAVSNLSSVTISFSATGIREQLIAFIKSIDTVSPIMIVDKVDITDNQGINTASLTIKTYFASLPEKIPTITEAVTDLTPGEKALLSQISKLSPPLFIDASVGGVGPTNPNPFGQ